MFLTLARAAAEHEKRERLEPSTDLDAWKAGYRKRIAAVEALLASLPENEQSWQRQHIASLKRALTLEPEGLRKAAERAYRSRSQVLVKGHPSASAPASPETDPARKETPALSQKGLRHRWIVSSSRSAPGGSPVPAPGAWPMRWLWWKGGAGKRGDA